MRCPHASEPAVFILNSDIGITTVMIGIVAVWFGIGLVVYGFVKMFKLGQ